MPAPCRRVADAAALRPQSSPSARGRWIGTKLVDVKDISRRRRAATRRPSCSCDGSLLSPSATAIRRGQPGQPHQHADAAAGSDRTWRARCCGSMTMATVSPDNPFRARPVRRDLHARAPRRLDGAMDPRPGTVWSVEKRTERRRRGERIDAGSYGSAESWDLGHFYLGSTSASIRAARTWSHRGRSGCRRFRRRAWRSTPATSSRNGNAVLFVGACSRAKFALGAPSDGSTSTTMGRQRTGRPAARPAAAHPAVRQSRIGISTCCSPERRRLIEIDRAPVEFRRFAVRGLVAVRC